MIQITSSQTINVKKLTLIFSATAVLIAISLVAFFNSEKNNRMHSVNSEFQITSADLDNTIKQLLRQRTKQQNSSMIEERLAAAFMQKAKLTGQYKYYDKVKFHLANAFEKSPKGAGPFLSRARLNYTLHRLEPIDADLRSFEKRILISNVQESDIAALRADVHFHNGNYQKAKVGYERAIKLHPSMSQYFRLAHFHWRMADFEKAEALIDKAEVLYHGLSKMPKAWLHLQRGLLNLDQGKLTKALTHYQNAEKIFDGWWLIKEHMAEIFTLQKKFDQAIPMYKELVEETGSGEFMNALAGIYFELNQNDQAKKWVQMANNVFNNQIKSFPEAAVGHALDHFLDYGKSKKKVVQLAVFNDKLRPGAEAKIKLAKAYLNLNENQLAKDNIDLALSTPWKSAELYLTAAKIYNALGMHKTNQKFLRLARAIDSSIDGI